MISSESIQLFYAFLIVVYVAYNNLPQPNVDISLLKLVEKKLDNFYSAADILAVKFIGSHLVIKKTHIGYGKKPFDIGIPYAAATVENGMNSCGFAQ